MSEALYQPALLAHAKDTAHVGRPEGASLEARADNPLCGDRVVLFGVAQAGQIVRMGHTARGCVVCKAATAILAARVAAVPLNAATLAAWHRDLDQLLAGGAVAVDLAPLAPAAAHPSRHACVRLAAVAADGLWSAVSEA